jgi:two-component system sensor histidine kinase TctE
MGKSNPTLRSKLLRFVLIPFSIILLIDIAGSYFAVRHVANSVYDVELKEIAHELLLHVTISGGRHGFDLSSEAERTLLADDDDQFYYAITAMDGSYIAGEPALAAMRKKSSRLESIYYDGMFHGQSVRIVQLAGVPVISPPPGPVGITVAATHFQRDRHEQELLNYVILPQIILILIAGVLISAGVAQGLSPLLQLRKDLARRSHLDLSPIDAENIPGEVEPLVHAINDLMKRVDSVIGFQNRFIADTAHQLRTPVAGLKAHIEVALRETELNQVQRALGHLYTSAERLSRLVSQLLSLARNEPQNVSANFQPFDLNHLALNTTQEWVPHAYKKNIDLGFEAAPEPVMLNGEATRITELINNLVDNAVRYTPAGGCVTVRVVPGERALLIVSDDGSRIPIEERKRIFERFHRIMGTHEEGSGLGLAIVHEIATLHEATIVLEDDADGVGNTFTVSFPMLHETPPPLLSQPDF